MTLYNTRTGEYIGISGADDKLEAMKAIGAEAELEWYWPCTLNGHAYHSDDIGSIRLSLTAGQFEELRRMIYGVLATEIVSEWFHLWGGGGLDNHYRTNYQSFAAGYNRLFGSGSVAVEFDGDNGYPVRTRIFGKVIAPDWTRQRANWQAQKR